MSQILEKMFARTGRKWDQFRPNSKTGLIVRQQGVPTSPEFDRICALPRRKWPEVPDLPFLQVEMSDWLKTPHGLQALRPVQATALAELHDLGNVFAPITCGGGKTHITFLASTVVDAQRPLLIIPAHLRDKTQIEFEVLARHWRAPLNLMIVTYQELGRKAHAEALQNRRPDLIVCDEVHRLRNLGAACTKRVCRWMEASPDTKFIAMSGTMTKRSLMDFHHFLMWTHGPERMPIPAEPSEGRRWALAVDAKVPMNRRMAPGILASFIETPTQDTTPNVQEVREALATRIMETPGVVGSLTDDVDASISMHFYEPELPPEVSSKMQEIVDKGESLHGDIILGPVELWRHMRELTCGFCYYWKYKPPREWMTLRCRWFGYQRTIQEQGYEGLDSPEQIEDAVKSGKLDSRGIYALWQAIKHVFEPEQEICWVSTQFLEEVLGDCSTKPTLIWVEHVAAGEKLVELSGFRFFHHGGRDQHGVPIESLDGTESIIVSIDSNSEGRNLQKWSRNYVVSAPPNGAVWEQMVSRTHRFGQEEDEVEFLIPLGHRCLRDGMAQAFADAKYITGITRKTQKLLLADTSGIHIHQSK